MNSKGKATVEAATSTTATKSIGNGSPNHATAVSGHIELRGQSTGLAYVFECGARYPRDDAYDLFFTLDEARSMVHYQEFVEVCPDCVQAQTERIKAQRRREEEQRRQAEECRRRESDIEDQLIELCEARRRGDTATVERLLDKLVQDDDEALARAGRTSWEADE